LPLEQALKALPSSWHRNFTPVCVSLKPKLALVWPVGFAGFEVMVGAGGGGALIVQVKLAAVLRFPAVSFASTANVWLPWLRPE
jgi:hypothetical protein